MFVKPDNSRPDVKSISRKGQIIQANRFANPAPKPVTNGQAFRDLRAYSRTYSRIRSIIYPAIYDETPVVTRSPVFANGVVGAPPGHYQLNISYVTDQTDSKVSWDFLTQSLSDPTDPSRYDIIIAQGFHANPSPLSISFQSVTQDLNQGVNFGVGIDAYNVDVHQLGVPFGILQLYGYYLNFVVSPYGIIVQTIRDSYVNSFKWANPYLPARTFTFEFTIDNLLNGHILEVIPIAVTPNDNYILNVNGWLDEYMALGGKDPEEFYATHQNVLPAT